MKVGIFNTVRGGVPRFAPYAAQYDGTAYPIELIGFDCPPLRENLHLLKDNGCEAMIYFSDHVEDDAFFKTIADNGVKYICCSSAGYDHFNLPAMKRHGLKGSNVPVYSPNAIAEHTVMLTLASLRHLRRQIVNVENNNYTFQGLLGKEMRNQVFGIIGAGRIGRVTMRCLSGFGPKQILAYDPYPNDKAKEFATFVSLDDLLAQSDVVILHAIYNEQNHHLISRERIASMKDGAILVNAARGGLVDTEALCEALESGKLSGAALDVIEDEGELKKQGGIFDRCPIPLLERLLRQPNFIFTPHSAFYTDEANRNLSEGTVENLHSYAATGSSQNELIQ